MLLKHCTQYANKFGKLSSGHRSGKCQFSFQSQRKAMSKNVQVQFSSVTQSCPTLCNPMDCSTPGFLFLHQLLKLAQTQVHQVSDAIQPSHPLSSPSPLASNFPSIRVFSNESVLPIRWTKYWSFSCSISPSNEYSGLMIYSSISAA